MSRAQIKRGIVFTALYILSRLRSRTRPERPRLRWHLKPDACYVLTLVIFQLAQKHLEDKPYNALSWLKVHRNSLELAGVFRPAVAPSGRQLFWIELEVLCYLDFNLDITFLSPDFCDFRRQLTTRPETLAILMVSLPADPPQSSLPQGPCPFLMPLPSISISSRETLRPGTPRYFIRPSSDRLSSSMSRASTQDTYARPAASRW